MLGKDLIRWIQDNKAEDLPVYLQYRDGGGRWFGEVALRNPETAEVAQIGPEKIERRIVL